MSRVVRFHRLGGPEVLEIEDLPDRTLKEGELRVRIEAIGLNRAGKCSGLAFICKHRSFCHSTAARLRQW